MSKITRNNYEEFFIDYFDGSLNNHEVAELMLFLAQNNDLDKEFNDFKYIELDEDVNVSFNFKDSLKKQDLTITGSVFYDKCIDKIEDNLSVKQIVDFDKEINSDINKKIEFESFKDTIIKPDLSLVFSDKDILKQKEFSIIKFKRIYQYAAILIAIIVSYTLFQNKTEYSEVANSTKQYASISNYGELSSFDKYDNQQSFTVIKRETPSIVAKSSSSIRANEPIIRPIHINRLDSRKIIVEDNIADNSVPVLRYHKQSDYTFNNIINEEHESEYSENKQDLLDTGDGGDNCNPNCLSALTNEIKSDVYISEMMSNYKDIDNGVSEQNNTNIKSVWELLGESISVITGAKIEKSYSDNGEVSRLALNGDRFRVSKKIRK